MNTLLKLVAIVTTATALTCSTANIVRADGPLVPPPCCKPPIVTPAAVPPKIPNSAQPGREAEQLGIRERPAVAGSEGVQAKKEGLCRSQGWIWQGGKKKKFVTEWGPCSRPKPARVPPVYVGADSETLCRRHGQCGGGVQLPSDTLGPYFLAPMWGWGHKTCGRQIGALLYALPCWNVARDTWGEKEGYFTGPRIHQKKWKGPAKSHPKQLAPAFQHMAGIGD